MMPARYSRLMKTRAGLVRIAGLLLALVLPASARWFGTNDEDLGVPDTEKSEFQKRFTAGYGVLSAKEPELSEIEGALLEKLGPVFERSPDLAQVMLEGMLAEDTPISATFNYILANIYYSQGAFDKAEEEYQAALKKFPDFRRAWTNYGILHVKRNDFQKAQEAFNKALVLGEQDPFLYGMLGYVLMRQKQYRSAEIAYNFATLHQPDNPEWLEGLAKVYTDTRQYVMARSVFDELIRSNPNDALYWKLQANAYLGMDKPLESARNLEIVRNLDASDSASLFLLGNIYANAGMSERALDAYVAAADMSKGRHLGAALAAVYYFIDQGDLSEAETLLDALADNRESWSREEAMQYRRMSARLALARGIESKAVDELEAVLKDDPFNSGALITLAEIHSESDQPERAFILLDRALKIDESKLNALLLYSRVLVRQFRYPEALPYLREALELDPSPALEDLYVRVESLVRTRNRN